MRAPCWSSTSAARTGGGVADAIIADLAESGATRRWPGVGPRGRLASCRSARDRRGAGRHRPVLNASLAAVGESEPGRVMDAIASRVACPGRGSYGAGSLGSLPPDHPAVERAESLRRRVRPGPLLELDGAATFDPRATCGRRTPRPLIFMVTLLDAERAAEDHDVAVVIGNSLGWYTALAIAGALSFDDAFRLVQEIALLQEEPLPSGGSGGQVIYPLTDADWLPVPDLRAVVAGVVDGHGDGNGSGRIYESVDLGAYAVLAGDDAGVAHLIDRLPPVKIGERLYPLRLAMHGPYHTPLVEHVAAGAAARLAGLAWRSPDATPDRRPRRPMVALVDRPDGAARLHAAASS